jgi:signal transduction histidine kinase
MREAANRLSEVVQRMQRFTNLNRAEVQPTCVNGLISDVVGLLDPGVRSRVGIELQLEHGLPLVTSHPQQLSAVFSMIIHNAVDSLDGTGLIRIVTRHDGAHVHIEIHDSGRGIPDDLLADLFEPAFRESSGRVGSANWNLFSCRHVIEAHGGEIHLSSLAGEGTTVHIALPVTTSPHG